VAAKAMLQHLITLQSRLFGKTVDGLIHLFYNTFVLRW
jgi:hypothetical protein